MSTPNNDPLVFVYRGVVAPGKRELRAEVREEHLTYQAQQANLAGGPLLDDSGEATGSFIVFNAPDRAAAHAVIEADPYIVHGVIEEWTIDLLFPALWPSAE